MPQNSSIPFNIKLAEKILIPLEIRTQTAMMDQQQQDQQNNLTSITWYPETWSLKKKHARFLEDTKDIPFWIHQTKPDLHRQILDTTQQKHEFHRPLCCFNHFIGLPRKEGHPKPIFDYELDIFNTVEKYNDVVILKARGLGITEFFLRYFVWKAVRNRDWANRTGALITGIRQETAIELIRRIRGYFLPFGIFFDTRENTVTINDVRFISFPAYNVDSLRSYTDFCFCFSDESAFFPAKQQTLLREAVEGYRLKSRPKIIWVSTVGEEFGDVMDQIQDEIREHKSPYKLIELPYELGVNKIYDPELIEQEKLQPYFPREYQLKKHFGIGNVLLETAIQKCQDIRYDPDHIVSMSPKVLGIDPAFGSSKFAIVVTQFTDSRIQVLYAKEFDRPEPTEMERLVLNLTREYGLFNSNQSNGQIIVDAANINFIKYIKMMLNERTDYDDIEESDLKYCKVRPVNFGVHHRHMLTNMVELITKGYVLIDPRFEDLILQLRIAKMDDKYGLLKKTHSLDLLDSLRLACFGFEIT